jgi:hypothetical protein
MYGRLASPRGAPSPEAPPVNRTKIEERRCVVTFTALPDTNPYWQWAARAVRQKSWALRDWGERGHQRAVTTIGAAAASGAAGRAFSNGRPTRITPGSTSSASTATPRSSSTGMCSVIPETSANDNGMSRRPPDPAPLPVSDQGSRRRLASGMLMSFPADWLGCAQATAGGSGHPPYRACRRPEEPSGFGWA